MFLQLKDPGLPFYEITRTNGERRTSKSRWDPFLSAAYVRKWQSGTGYEGPRTPLDDLCHLPDGIWQNQPIRDRDDITQALCRRNGNEAPRYQEVELNYRLVFGIRRYRSGKRRDELVKR